MHIKQKYMANSSRCFLLSNPFFSEQLVDKLQHLHICNICWNANIKDISD